MFAQSAETPLMSLQIVSLVQTLTYWTAPPVRTHNSHWNQWNFCPQHECETRSAAQCWATSLLKKHGQLFGSGLQLYNEKSKSNSTREFHVAVLGSFPDQVSWTLKHQDVHVRMWGVPFVPGQTIQP